MAIYLVTGGAGFIGSHIVDALLDQGEQVVILDNLSTGLRSNVEGTVKRRGLAEEGSFCWISGENVKKDGLPTDPRLVFVEGDICDPALCRAVTDGADFILHQAALPSVPRSVADPLTTHVVNVNGTLNLLIAAKESRDRIGRLQRLVYASSSSVYGDTPTLPKVESMPPAPLSPYAASKLFGEIYCQVFHRTYGLPTVSLRYFNIYGPRQNPDSPYAAAIPRFVARLLTDQPPEIFGDGRQSRDFTYIADCVQANLLACHAPEVSGEVFNVACGGRTEILRICELLSKHLGKMIPPHHLPPRPGDVRHSQADIAKAKDCLNYRPKFDIEAGLSLMLSPWLGQDPSDGSVDRAPGKR